MVYVPQLESDPPSPATTRNAKSRCICPVLNIRVPPAARVRKSSDPDELILLRREHVGAFVRMP